MRSYRANLLLFALCGIILLSACSFAMPVKTDNAIPALDQLELTDTKADSCPSGYILKPGDCPHHWGDAEAGGAKFNVEAASTCAEYCTKHKPCNSFEYSPTEKRCHLNKAADPPSSKVWRDYMYCVKSGIETCSAHRGRDALYQVGHNLKRMSLHTSSASRAVQGKYFMSKKGSDCARLCKRTHGCWIYVYFGKSKRWGYLQQNFGCALLTEAEAWSIGRATPRSWKKNWWRSEGGKWKGHQWEVSGICSGGSAKTLCGSADYILKVGGTPNHQGAEEIEGVATASACSAQCTKKKMCNSFEYSPSKEECHLNKAADPPSRKNYEDYSHCVKPQMSV